MTYDRIIRCSNKGCRCIFSLSIPFIHWTTHKNLHELESLFVDGGTTRDHKPNSAAEIVPNLTENNFIIDAMIIVTILVYTRKFGAEPWLNQTLNQACLLRKTLLNLLNDPIENPWDSNENGGFNHLTIIFDF